MENTPARWEELERRAAEQARAYSRQAQRSRPSPPPQPPAKQPPPRLLGRFSADQLLLAALLCLLVQEKADPQLILAVAYILLS